MSQPVRTRYAPSPTGPVHIGNIRVAIFNWLHARRTGGQFLLRIEDTDRERSTPEALEQHLTVMRWLGLDWDEEPVHQSTRLERHLAVAEDLLSRGLAYRDDFGQPELGQAVVFRMPGRDIVLRDEVKGEITKKAEDMKDLVIVRGDGSPVFHLANVVDDIDMEINCVIRGDDHVENTFRHLALQEAMGAGTPRYAHLPMIVNAQGKPYSKRDGDAYVGDFRGKGILPEALFNFLALLGWNPGDGREVMDRDALVAAFDFSGVQASPAGMDMKKLEWMNGEYLRALPLPEYRGHALEHLPDAKPGERLDQVIELVRDRVKLWTELPAKAACFFTDDYPVDEKAARKRLGKEGVPEALAAFADLLSETDDVEDSLDSVCASRGLGKGQLMPALRLAVTGQSGGPDLVQTLRIIGTPTVAARIRRAVAGS